TSIRVCANGMRRNWRPMPATSWKAPTPRTRATPCGALHNTGRTRPIRRPTWCAPPSMATCRPNRFLPAGSCIACNRFGHAFHTAGSTRREAFQHAPRGLAALTPHVARGFTQPFVRQRQPVLADPALIFRCDGGQGLANLLLALVVVALQCA